MESIIGLRIQLEDRETLLASEDILDSYRYYKTLSQGEIWISRDRFSVEWVFNNQLVRKFQFKENWDNKIIDAGFIDFNKKKNCLIIILRDVAHIYLLDDGTSTKICFPFPIKKVFWFEKGLLLERKFIDKFDNVDYDHRFITLTDPLSPFGTISFNASKNNNNSGTNGANNTISEDFELLHFPKNKDFNIAVFFNRSSNNISFYYTRIMTNNMDLSFTNPSRITSKTTNKKSFSQSITETLEISKKVRKTSIMSRRNIVPNLEINNLEDTSSFNNATKRNISATMDRMGNYLPPLESPLVAINNNNSNIIVNNPSQLSVSQAQEQPNYSKDILLVEISSMVLPSYIDKNWKDSVGLKIIPLFYNQQESIVIFDSVSKFCKIWIIDMLPDIINSVSFKIYGNSPPDLIRLLNIMTPNDLTIDDIMPYELSSINSPNELNGNSVVIKYKNLIDKFAFYNPFSQILSPFCNVAFKENSGQMVEKELIKFTFDYNNEANVLFNHIYYRRVSPKEKIAKKCFLAIKWICSSDIYFAILYLWQYMLNEEHILGEFNLNKNDHLIELNLLLIILKSLIYSKVPTSENIICNKSNYLNQTQLFIDILKANSPFDISITLPKIIMGIHLIREELLLNIFCLNESKKLNEFLALAIHTMNWPQLWKKYYNNVEILNVELNIANNDVFAHPLEEPPSILKTLYSVTAKSQISLTKFISFSKLIDGSSDVDLLITPRSFKILRLYEYIHTPDFKNKYILDILTKLNITAKEINTFPIGVSAPIKNILNIVENSILQPNANVDLSLISRLDIERFINIMNKSNITKGLDSNSDDIDDKKFQSNFTRIGKKSKPKDAYSLVTDIIAKTLDYGLTSNDNNVSRDRDLVKENIEFIFSQDKRFQQSLNLLDGTIPHNVHFITVNSEYSEILARKKLFAKIIALRTLSSGIGSAAINIFTEQPLTSQKWIIKNLNFTSYFPDGSKITADCSDMKKELLQWGEFHNGVASALKIAKNTPGINSSWISLNKPKKLNATHGGFLFGMGLNGHLKDLEEWHVYNYLSPKQTFTSVGLLLGMSASSRGTKNYKLVKVLAVHIVALLPKGSSDLNINIGVQIAGLIGMGLLYQSCKDKKMSTSLVDELSTFVKIGDDLVANEAYRMAVGIAIGLNNLGSGNSRTTNEDEHYYGDETMQNSDEYSDLDEFNLATNATYNHASFSYDSDLVNSLLSIINMHYDREPNWIPENSQIGSIIAIMLIFLKSHNDQVASKIRLPLHNFSKNVYYKPEIFLYREWAYFMINWDHIESSLDFILHDIPPESITTLDSDSLPIYYTVAGRILSMGIKFASTNSFSNRNSIITLLDRLLPLYQFYRKDSSPDFRFIIKAISILINICIIALSMIMCATGDLEVLRRVKYLHEIVTGRYSDLYKKSSAIYKTKLDTTTSEKRDEFDVPEQNNAASMDDLPNADADSVDLNPDGFTDPSSNEDKEVDRESHFGKYISTNMALGFLFLGSGQYALRTSNLESIAYLILSVLPTYSTPYPLQELKHFWSMAVEPRCLVVKDAITEKPINGVKLKLTVKSPHKNKLKELELVAPCLLPDIRTIQELNVEINNYYPLHFKFNKDFMAKNLFKEGMVIYLQFKDKENIKINNTKDIEVLLNKELVNSDNNDVDNINDSVNNFFSELGLNDVTMIEMQSILEQKEKGTPTSASDEYNLEMLCTDDNNGDTIDYQIELWKSQQSQLSPTNELSE